MSRILDLAHTGTSDATTEIASEPGSALTAVTILVIAAVLVGAGIALRGRVQLSAALRASGLAAALAVLALQVHDAGWLTGCDESVTSWIVAHRTPVLDAVAVTVTNLGSPAATAALAVLVAAFLTWRTRSPLPGAVLVATVGAAAVSSTALKLLIGRSRPPAAVQQIVETDLSFPSGHVTGTATLAVMIVVIATVGMRPRIRVLLTVVAGLAAVVVAATRVYLGVHWLTDVIGGALLAAFWITIGATTLHSVSVSAVTVFDGSPQRRDPARPTDAEVRTRG